MPINRLIIEPHAQRRRDVIAVLSSQSSHAANEPFFFFNPSYNPPRHLRTYSSV
jgi:hypothetical protein